MKTFILILVFVASSCAQDVQGRTQVASGGGGGGGNTITTTLKRSSTVSIGGVNNPTIAITPGASGDLMVVCVDYKLNGGLTSVTDNNCGGGGSNTWTLIDSVADGVNTISAACYKWASTCTSSNTITFNGITSASDRVYAVALEHHGSSTTPVTDGVGHSLPNAASWVQAVTVGTTGDLLFGFGGNAASIGTYSAGAGMTALDAGGSTGCDVRGACTVVTSSTVSSGSQNVIITPSSNFNGTMIGYALK